MIPCLQVEILTPKKVLLNGLWFGPRRAPRVIVFLHGLGGSLFRDRGAHSWAEREIAVLVFNNRGHDQISEIHILAKGSRSIRSKCLAGEAHEVFTDCVDDIAGAVAFAKRQGAKEIFVVGHSTGCQKAVYYASTKRDPKVKGLILLAPVSDYASAMKHDRGGRLARAARAARSLVARGRPHDLLPQSVWREYHDAQRFLSLYTPESAEEIFCYAQKGKVPRTLQKVKVPMLVLWAERDEHADRSPEESAAWFTKYLSVNRKSKVQIVPEAFHHFRGQERELARRVKQWLSASL